MVKFTCPHCDYQMQTAQYLNGKGHCLKCDAVVAHTQVHPLNPEWTRKMKMMFDKLNADGKVNMSGFGTLDFEDMSALLRKANPDMTDDELELLFKAADTNGNNVIEFSEFLWFLYGQTGFAGGREARTGSRDVPHKLSPSDAGESSSGECAKNDGGPHDWKFGKCRHCGKGEGQLAKGPGTFANAGGAGGCGRGGKCMYKFGKCTKCSKSEF